MSEKINRESISTILANDEYRDYAANAIAALADYADLVMRYDDKKIILNNLSGEEYREEFQTLDKKRTRTHDAAIDALSLLNKIAAGLSIMPVFDGETTSENRGNIAHAIIEYYKARLDEDGYGGEWK